MVNTTTATTPTLSQWRQYPFFEREEISLTNHAGVSNNGGTDLLSAVRATAAATDATGNGEDTAPFGYIPNSKSLAWLLKQPSENVNIMVAASGRGSLFLGDSVKGTIYIVNHAMSILFEFNAFARNITHLQMLSSRNILLSIGDDDDGIPVIKCWNLDKMDRQTRTPQLILSYRIQHNNRVFPVTALAALESMSQIAIGLENGVVLLLRKELVRDKLKQVKVIYESSEIVTGLGFYEDSKSTALYIVTLARVVVCMTNLGKETMTVLEEQGSEIGCSILTPHSHNPQMVVGRNEAVYFYGLDGRGPCFIIESDKTQLSWFKNYLVVVSRPLKNKFALNTSLPQNPQDHDEAGPGLLLTIYDLRSKFIAYRGTFGPGEWEDAEVGSARPGAERPAVPIKLVVAEWGELYIITMDGRMYRLEEKDLNTKLEILFQKNMYSLALSVASPSHSVLSLDDTSAPLAGSTTSLTSAESEDTASILSQIHKRYADHLYNKSEFDAAMGQYIKTIGYLEPSYVIRKYFDAQRLHSLTLYLQALHEFKGGLLVNADHTTLLINCYTKLKDQRRLEEFIKREGDEGSFDVDTAIRVCRTAAYFDHAAWLAERFARHQEYLQIIMDDLADFRGAITYIGRLPFTDQVRELRRYGAALVNELPGEITEILVRLCATQLELKLSAERQKRKGQEEGGVPNGFLDKDETDVQQLKPEAFVALYVQKPDWCIVFLEKLLESRFGVSSKGKQPANTPVVSDGISRDIGDEAESLRACCNILLELYLDPSISTPTINEPANRRKALRLLENRFARFDENRALLQCKSKNFEDGILFLLDKMNLPEDILSYHMENKNYPAILAACRKYGDARPVLWTKALAYFADQGPSGESSVLSAHNEVAEVLDVIDKQNLLPPLQVIKIMARNPAVTIGMVRGYLVKRLETERKQVEEKLSQSYREETTKMKAQVEEMKTAPTVFQATKCSMCGQTLDLPTIHFMCKHSYHVRCLAETQADRGKVTGQGNFQECPRCAPEHHMVQDMMKKQADLGGRYDVFQKRLEDSADDRFAVVAEYLGKNIFSSS